MPKTCEASDCGNPRFGKGYCKWHQHLRTDKKPKQKSYNSFKPISDKRAEELIIYRPLRDGYMAEHLTCEVEGCNRLSNDLHHKMGRVGYADDWARENQVKLLWDVRWFMAICRPDHTKCDLEPNWARENGYLV